jgi:hypothetical protein
MNMASTRRAVFPVQSLAAARALGERIDYSTFTQSNPNSPFCFDVNDHPRFRIVSRLVPEHSLYGDKWQPVSSNVSEDRRLPSVPSLADHFESGKDRGE